MLPSCAMNRRCDHTPGTHPLAPTCNPTEMQHANQDSSCDNTNATTTHKQPLGCAGSVPATLAAGMLAVHLASGQPHNPACVQVNINVIEAGAGG
jgi:hypothetical protein